MNTHTPEPWSIHSTDGSEWALIGPGATIPWICDLKQNAEANARRIQICVNACAGISHQELTHGPVIPLQRYSTLANQRDELEAALRFGLNNMHKWTGSTGPGAIEFIQKASAALAAMSRSA